jgi:hypothetical protein
MKINSLIDFSVIEDIEKEILNSYSEHDDVYFFNSQSIDKLNSQKLYKKETFNCFTIYSKNIYTIFIKIKQMFNEVCKTNQINFTKNMFYISTEYLNNCDSTFWYDSGGDKPLCFSGYIVLDCLDNSTIKVDDEIFNVVPGTILLFGSSSKIIFNNKISVINFNIAPISLLSGQYKQKWIPLS